MDASNSHPSPPTKRLITAEQYRNHYKAENKVYEREELLRIHRKLLVRSPEVGINTILGTYKDYNFSLFELYRSGADYEAGTGSFLHYRPIQQLICPERCMQRGKTVEMPWTYYPIELDFYGFDMITSKTELSSYDALKRFQEAQQEWNSSELCKDLVQQLSSAQLRPIDTIICFGLGPFHGNTEGYYPSCVQHAAIATIREILGKSFPGVEIRTLCQDPAYSEADKQFLHGKGYTVVRDPVGLLDISESSLVYSVDPGFCVKQITADMPRPAAMLWGHVQPTVEEELEEAHRRDELEERRGFKPWGYEIVDDEVVPAPIRDSSSRRVRAMLREYDVMDLPENECFTPTSLCIRK